MKIVVSRHTAKKPPILNLHAIFAVHTDQPLHAMLTMRVASYTVLSWLPCRGQLQIRCLWYLNDLKFVIFCHSEYVCRSFFKTRNSRTSKFHVVFLFPREFSGVRFTFRIAKHVKFIHFNLPSTRISCARIFTKKKNPFIRK